MRKIIIFPILFLILASFSYADMGPKPTANFEITMNGQKITDPSFSSAMMTCIQQEDIRASIEGDVQKELYTPIPDLERGCSWYPNFLAWGGKCSNSACNHHYFLPSEFRFAVYLPSTGKVYLSDEITRSNFNSYFLVDLKSDGTIDILETTPFFTTAIFKIIIIFLISLGLTILIELVVTAIFITEWKLPKRLYKFTVFANLITLIILWALMMVVQGDAAFIVFIVGEILIMIFEGYFIYHFNKDVITYKRSAIMSITMNLASLLIGGVIMLFITFFFSVF